MEKNELVQTVDVSVDVSDEEIREHFKLITQRPISQRTLSVGKCIAKIAQWHIVEMLKLGLLPLRVGNYYLVKADMVDELFKKLDKNTIEQDKKNNAS